MDKSQVRSCINETFPIGYNPLTGNVFIDTTGATLNDTLVYTSSGVVWQAGGGGGVTGSGTAGQIAYWNGSGSITGENTLWYDATNDRVGIGTNSPSFDLHIAKATVGSAVEARVSNTDNTNGASHAHLTVITGGSGGTSSGGDPHVLFAVNTAQNFALGIDNSVSGKPFKLSWGANLGTNDVMTINQGGDMFTLNNVIGGSTVRGTRITAINAADTLASKTIVVRNAADSADRFSVNGNGSISLTASTGNVLHLFDSGSAGSGYLIGSNSAFSGTNSFLQVAPGSLTMILSGTSAGFQFTQAGNTGYIVQSNQTAVLQFSQASTWGSWKFGVGKGNMYLATTIGFSWSGGERGTFAMENAVEPASNTTNAIQIFSKNITNASFHVRDSNSRIFYAGEKVGMRSNHDLQLAANDTVYLTISTAGLLTLADASNIAVGTTTGTKIGTATTQKLSFWGKTPIVQPTTAITGATLVTNLGTPITSTDTFGGYTLQQIAAALINTGILQ